MERAYIINEAGSIKQKAQERVKLGKSGLLLD